MSRKFSEEPYDSANLREIQKKVNNLRFRTMTASGPLITADQEYKVRVNSATPVTVTVPTNASAAFPIGSCVIIRQVGAGLVTFAPASGVTINRISLEMNGQNSDAILHKVGTDEWDLSVGGVATPTGPDTTPPLVSSIQVITAFPNVLDILINEAIDDTLPEPGNGDFLVLVNGLTRAVTGIASSSPHVAVTIDGAAIAAGDTILVSYGSGTNKIKDLAGNILASFSDHAVDNLVSGGSGVPVVTGMVAVDAHTISVSFDRAVTPTTAGWTFKRGVTTMAVSGFSQPTSSVANFTITDTMLSSDTLTGAYDATTGNTVATSGGAELATFGATSITNSIGVDSNATAYINHINGLAAGTITVGAPYHTLFTSLKAALGGSLTKIKRMYLARFTTIALDSVNMVNPGTNDIISMSVDLQLSDDGADNQDGDSTFAETDSMTAWGVTNTNFCCMIGLRPKIGTVVTTYNAPFGSTMTSDDHSVRMRWTDSIDVRFNASDLGTDSTSNNLGPHHYAVSRLDNVEGKMYVDKVLLHTQTIAASPLPTTLFCIGAERTEFATRLYPIVRPWYYFIGADGLTATEIADVTDAWETFMDSFGKGLI